MHLVIVPQNKSPEEGTKLSNRFLLSNGNNDNDRDKEQKLSRNSVLISIENPHILRGI